jgi:segregation and condensation protein A
VSPEQVVVPVVYGQQVPEDAVTPPPDADASADVVPAPGAEDSGKFTVRLKNFTGPFDLLLQLIGKHKLDVTEVALHTVTDDFIAYIRAMGDDWDLGEASEFLLVAATLLDLKAARLLPAAEVEDEEDLALLEARDLLFARLLQYKAFKEAAAYISGLEDTGAKRWPRDVSMEPRYAEALPDLVLGIGVERLFKLALKQFMPKPGPPQVSIAHIHQMRVSVREHAQLLRDRLRRAGSATFTLLIADCESTLEVVARFLALLELYREGLIEFEQPVSLEELTVRWIGGEAADAELDIDDYEGSKPEPDEAASEPGAEPEAESDESDLSDEVETGFGERADLGGLDLLDDADLDDADLDDADLDDADLDAFDVGDVDLGDFGLDGGRAELGEPSVAGDETGTSDLSDEPSGEWAELGSGPDDLSGIGAGSSDDVAGGVDPMDEAVPAEGVGEGKPGVPADGEAGGAGGGSGAGAMGTSGAMVSDSGDIGAGRFDTPEDRRDLGGGDDDAAPAVVEERS